MRNCCSNSTSAWKEENKRESVEGGVGGGARHAEILPSRIQLECMTISEWFSDFHAMMEKPVQLRYEWWLTCFPRNFILHDFSHPILPFSFYFSLSIHLPYAVSPLVFLARTGIANENSEWKISLVILIIRMSIISSWFEAAERAYISFAISSLITEQFRMSSSSYEASTRAKFKCSIPIRIGYVRITCNNPSKMLWYWLKSSELPCMKKMKRWKHSNFGIYCNFTSPPPSSFFPPTFIAITAILRAENFKLFTWSVGFLQPDELGRKLQAVATVDFNPNS